MDEQDLILEQFVVRDEPANNSGGNNLPLDEKTEPKQEAQLKEPQSNNAPNPKEIFGEDIDDWDKGKAAWQENQSKLSELDGLRQSKKQLEEMLANPQGLYADEEVAEFNNFVKHTKTKNYDLFSKVKSHNPESDPIGTLVLKEVLDNPALLGKEDLIKKRLMKSFEVDPDVNTADEIELGTLNVQAEARKAAEAINTIKAELGKFPQQPQKTNAEDAKKLWQPIIEEELSALNVLGIPIKRGDKVEKLIDYALTPELKKEYSNQLSDIFASAGPVSPEVRAKVKEVFAQRFMVNHMPDIIHAVETNLRTTLEQEYDKTYNGVKFNKEPGSSTTTSGDENYEKLFDN